MESAGTITRQSRPPLEIRSLHASSKVKLNDWVSPVLTFLNLSEHSSLRTLI